MEIDCTPADQSGQQHTSTNDDGRLSASSEDEIERLIDGISGMDIDGDSEGGFEDDCEPSLEYPVTVREGRARTRIGDLYARRASRVLRAFGPYCESLVKIYASLVNIHDGIYRRWRILWVTSIDVRGCVASLTHQRGRLFNDKRRSALAPREPIF